MGLWVLAAGFNLSRFAEVLQSTLATGPSPSLVRRVEEGELLEVLDGPKEERFGDKRFDTFGEVWDVKNFTRLQAPVWHQWLLHRTKKQGF